MVRVHDHGPGPADPLTGLVPAPGGSAGAGFGLWLIHQFKHTVWGARSRVWVADQR